MLKADQLKTRLKPGHVYRRTDLLQWTTAVDRYLAELLEDGSLQKVAAGVYYAPKATAFGQAPPTEAELVRAFLKMILSYLPRPMIITGWV